MLTDIHLNPGYVPELESNTFCMSTEKAREADEIAEFGRPGCDSPRLLVETMMNQMRAQHPDLEVILVPGDLVTHAYASDTPDETNEKYDNITGVLDTVSQLFEIYFPSAIVLPTIGNNDTEFHYNPEEGANKKVYYDSLIKDWFTGHTGNKDLPNLDDIQATMDQGGWYRVDIPGADLSILSIDTLFYNTQMMEATSEAEDEQLAWLRKQLEEAGEGHKFILLSHIYETASYYQIAYDNWKQSDGYFDTFTKLLEDHVDKIVF